MSFASAHSLVLFTFAENKMIDRFSSWYRTRALRSRISDIEKKCNRIRKSGHCYVLLFDPITSVEGKSLSGIFAITKSSDQIGCIEATDGEKTEEFYFNRGGLQTYLRYHGREPTWLERKKFGIEPTPISEVARLTSGSDEEEWNYCREKFSKIQSQITNLSEPAECGNG